jgi:hypothetical protein
LTNLPFEETRGAKLETLRMQNLLKTGFAKTLKPCAKLYFVFSAAICRSTAVLVSARSLR